MHDAATATALTEQDQELFVEHGCVLVRGVLTSAQIDAAIADLEAGEAQSERVLSCIPSVLDDAVAELTGGKAGPHRFAGDRPRPYTPEAPWAAGCHCDLVYPQILPDTWAVGAFVFLTRPVSRGGAFMVAPGSPRRFKRLVTENSPELLWEAQACASGDLVEVLAEPGDALLFAHMMGHSATPNLTDPRTRHALDARWPLTEPVCVDGAPRSALERANSGRYLSQKFGDPLTLPVAAAPAPVGEAVTSHDIVRLDGFWWVLWSDAGRVLRVARSKDLASWQVVPSDQVPVDGPLHVEPRWGFTLTSAARTWISRDLRSWTPAAGGEPEAGMLGRMHFVHETQGSRAASGRVQTSVTDQGVRWRSGPALGNWTLDGWARKAPGIESAAIYPVVDTCQFALVCDIGGISHVAQSPHSDTFNEALLPFEPAVSGLRLAARGPRCWIVSFVREGRVRFGFIDWEAAPGRVAELTCAAEVARAYARTGLV